MEITRITIENFGNIDFYQGEFSPGLNILEHKYAREISAAMGILLCNRETLPGRKNARLSAAIVLHEDIYEIRAAFRKGRWFLSATASDGMDATAEYRYALLHCREQDAIEKFDGGDPSVTGCLARYRCDEEYDLSGRTDRLGTTKTFRAYLHRYIRDFAPEPINCHKPYMAFINARGEFTVRCGGEKIFLSETEQRLFRYTCFLNIAEFWAELEKIRNLHHEKKPLTVHSFLEFLDESTDIRRLIARTRALERQVFLLTPPLEEKIKQNWIGNDL